MGYVSTFAEEMTSARGVRTSGGLFAHPAAVASVLIISACATFFAVRGIINSSFYGGLPDNDTAVVSLADAQEQETQMTTVTTTAAPETVTTTTTEAAATTAATTTAAPVQETAGRFQRANLLYPAAFPDVSIPGLTLPAEFENGLLDPEAAFWLINQLRAQNGLPPFERADSRLGEATGIRARELFSLFSQTRPDGTGYATAYDQCGVEYQYTMESVGYGQYTAEHIVSDWINSEANLKNLLNTTCSRVYIVCAVGDDNVPVWVLEGVC